MMNNPTYQGIAPRKNPTMNRNHPRPIPQQGRRRCLTGLPSATPPWTEKYNNQERVNIRTVEHTSIYALDLDLNKKKKRK
jgi:hypothetical protein